MGKTRGADAARRLVDKAIYPPSVARQQVPPEECEETQCSVGLGPDDKIIGRFVLWQDRYMVEFALMQFTRVGGRWVEVFRIDTEHDKIHKHQLRRGSPDTQGTVTDLVEIPPDEGWRVVDKGYTNALSIIQNEWRENFRRWRGDTQ
jgi:hypothetical protein